MRLNLIALIDHELEFFTRLRMLEPQRFDEYRLSHHPAWLEARSARRNARHWITQLARLLGPLGRGHNVVFGTALVRLLWPFFWWSRRFVWVVNELPTDTPSTPLGRLDTLIMRRARRLYVSSRERAAYVAERYGRPVEVIPNLPHLQGRPEPRGGGLRDGMVYSGLVSARRLPPAALERLGRLEFRVDLYGFEVDSLTPTDRPSVRFRGTLAPETVRNRYSDYEFGLLAYPTSDVNNDLCAPIKLFEYLHHGCVCVLLNENRGLVALMADYPALFRPLDTIAGDVRDEEFECQRDAFLRRTRVEVDQAVARVLTDLGVTAAPVGSG